MVESLKKSEPSLLALFAIWTHGACCAATFLLYIARPTFTKAENHAVLYQLQKNACAVADFVGMASLGFFILSFLVLGLVYLGGSIQSPSKRAIFCARIVYLLSIAIAMLSVSSGAMLMLVLG